jgi:hypothetical protein
MYFFLSAQRTPPSTLRILMIALYLTGFREGCHTHHGKELKVEGSQYKRLHSNGYKQLRASM